MFRVIEGGRAAVGTAAAPADAEEVRREAVRRIRAMGYDEAVARSFLTGRPMPEDMVYLKLQIDFAGAALARLKPVPADFRDAKYWPDA